MCMLPAYKDNYFPMILFAFVLFNLEIFIFEKLRLEQVYALLFSVILFNMKKIAL